MKHPCTNPRKEARVIGCLAVLLIPALAMQVRAQTETVLYTFTGSSDGGVPYAALISDNEGNFYGTTMQYGSGPCTYPFAGCGTVFELSPVNDGRAVQWRFKVLYTFQGGSDGANPVSELIFDPAGNLYGTTGAGGFGCGGTGCGTVFELKKSESGWTEKVLYRFTGQSDGANPGSSLALDSHGNVYGTATYGGDSNCDFNGPGCGVVFRLSPIHHGAENTWVETVLHTFDRTDGANPFAGVTLGLPELCGAAAGQVCVFGTTMYGGYQTIEPGGVAFELIPNGASWAYRMLYEFPGGCGGPGGPLVLDKSGILYGETHLGGQACSGDVFSLQPNPAVIGQWTWTDLYSFEGPGGAFPYYQGLVMDQRGNLYGTTSRGGDSSNCEDGCGTVFRLSKTTGGGGWYESGLYSLEGGPDGWGPLSGNLVLNSTGVYGMTPQGGDPGCTGIDNQPGCGVIYRIGP